MHFRPFCFSAAAVLAACSSQRPEPVEPSPPPISALGKPIETFSLAFSAISIEGCSQSEMSSSHKGSLTLHLLSGSRAALIFEGTSFEVYTSRTDDRSTRHWSRDYAVWLGRARRDAGGLLIELGPKGKRCEALPLYGEGPGVKQRCLYFHMNKGETIGLRCSSGAVTVTQRRERLAGEPRESVEDRPALRCRPASRLPYPMDFFVLDGHLSFPLDPGIQFSYIDDLGLGGARFESSK
jgi:hypothetical protein